MLDNYIKKIENLITPTYYDRNNYKEKILSEGNNFNEEDIEPKFKTFKKPNYEKFQKKNSKEYEKKNQIDKKKQENEGKLENPELDNLFQRTLAKTEEINEPIRKIKGKEYSDNDIETLLEKVKSLNLKNMNYRYEIEKYKNKINQLQKDYDIQIDLQNKMEKEKENLTKYLLKLEKMLQNKSKPIIINSTNSNISTISNNQNNMSITATKKSVSIFNTSNINISVSGNNPIITIIDNVRNIKHTILSRDELQNFLLKIYKENQKLKAFQSQVFELSKNYDDINSNIEESLKKLQETIKNSNNGNNIGQEILTQFQDFTEKIDKILETKQIEYNLLLKGKDDELNIISEELINVSKELEERKSDRLKEQKIIFDLENEIKELKKQNISNENITRKNINNNYDIISMKSEQQAKKLTEPAQVTVNNILKNIESNFNMNDKSNVKLIGDINKTINRNNNN